MQVGKESGRAVEIEQLALAGEEKLPTSVQPDNQQKR
jgi:hypothetical protein